MPDLYAALHFRQKGESPVGIGCLCLIGIAALIGGGLWFARRQQHDKATDEEITSDEA